MRRSLRRSLSVAGFGLLAMVSDRPGPRAQDIDDVMHTALRSSLTVKADDARQAAVGAALRGSLDAFMPTVAWVQETMLSSKIHYSPDVSLLYDGIDTLARKEPDLHGIQVSLPLFDGMKRFNTFRMQDTLFDAGKQLQVNVRQQVLLDTATAYAAVLRDRRIVEFRRAYLKDLSNIEQRTRMRYAARDVTLTDLALAESRVMEARTELDQALSDLSTSSIGFTRVSGSAPEAVGTLVVPNDRIPTSVQDLQQCLVQQNPKLQASHLQATAAHYNALAAAGEVLPQLNLVAQRVVEDNVSAAETHVRDTTVKLQLRVPIYEPGLFPRIGRTSAEATQKYYEFLDSQNQALADATALFYERRSTIDQIESARRRIAAVQRAVEGYGIELAAGYRTILDLLNTRAELARARIILLNLEFARDKQTFTLAAALARLSPNLSTPVPPPPVAARPVSRPQVEARPASPPRVDARPGRKPGPG